MTIWGRPSPVLADNSISELLVLETERLAAFSSLSELVEHEEHLLRVIHFLQI